MFYALLVIYFTTVVVSAQPSFAEKIKKNAEKISEILSTLQSENPSLYDDCKKLIEDHLISNNIVQDNLNFSRKVLINRALLWMLETEKTTTEDKIRGIFGLLGFGTHATNELLKEAAQLKKRADEKSAKPASKKKERADSDEDLSKKAENPAEKILRKAEKSDKAQVEKYSDKIKEYALQEGIELNEANTEQKARLDEILAGLLVPLEYNLKSVKKSLNNFGFNSKATEKLSAELSQMQKERFEQKKSRAEQLKEINSREKEDRQARKKLEAQAKHDREERKKLEAQETEIREECKKLLEKCRKNEDFLENLQKLEAHAKEEKEERQKIEAQAEQSLEECKEFLENLQNEVKANLAKNKTRSAIGVSIFKGGIFTGFFLTVFYLIRTKMQKNRRQTILTKE